MVPTLNSSPLDGSATTKPRLHTSSIGFAAELSVFTSTHASSVSREEEDEEEEEEDEDPPLRRSNCRLRVGFEMLQMLTSFGAVLRTESCREREERCGERAKRR